MNEIIIEYDDNGRIARIIIPNPTVFDVVSQSDNYIAGKLISSRLSNLPVEGGVVGE